MSNWKWWKYKNGNGHFQFLIEIEIHVAYYSNATHRHGLTSKRHQILWLHKTCTTVNNCPIHNVQILNNPNVLSVSIDEGWEMIHVRGILHGNTKGMNKRNTKQIE